MSYQQYLKSDYWRNKKKLFKNTETYKYGCIVCTWKKCDVHHLTYSTLGKEDVNKDLVLLCHPHHEEFHKWQKLNNKIEGDLLEWMFIFYPERYDALLGFLKSKIQSISKYDPPPKPKENKRIIKLLNIINSKYAPVVNIHLNKKERKLLAPVTMIMLNKLKIKGNTYNEKVKNFICMGVSKELLIDFLSNYNNYLMEYKEHKKYYSHT